MGVNIGLDLYYLTILLIIRVIQTRAQLFGPSCLNPKQYQVLRQSRWISTISKIPSISIFSYIRLKGFYLCISVETIINRKISIFLMVCFYAESTWQNVLLYGHVNAGIYQYASRKVLIFVKVSHQYFFA